MDINGRTTGEINYIRLKFEEKGLGDRETINRVYQLLEERGYTEIMESIPSLRDFIKQLEDNGVDPTRVDELIKRFEKYGEGIIRVLPMWGSKKMRDVLGKTPNRFINNHGKEIEYQIAGENIAGWDDVEFLGYGIYL